MSTFFAEISCNAYYIYFVTENKMLLLVFTLRTIKTGKKTRMMKLLLFIIILLFLLVPGFFSIQKGRYLFKQSKGREKIQIVRSGGDKGAVALPWKVSIFRLVATFALTKWCLLDPSFI